MFERIEARLDEYQKLLYEYRWYLVILGFGALISYGFWAFNLMLAGDDWVFFVNGNSQDVWVVILGRWMQRLIWDGTQDGLFSPPFTLSVFVVGLIFSGWLQSRVIGLEKQSSVFFFVALLMFHPFWSEEINFKLNHILVAVGVSLASLSAYVLHHSNRALFVEGTRWWGITLIGIGAILLGLAVATKQVYLFFTVGAVVFGILADALKASDFATPRYIIYRMSVTIVAVVLGLLFYVISVDVSQRLVGVNPLPPDHAYSLTGSIVSSTEEVTFTLRRFVDTFITYHFRSHFMMPVYTKYVYLVALLAFVIHTIRTRRVAQAPLVLLGLAGIMVMPWVLGILRVPDNSYRYTALVPNAAIYAAVIAIVLDQTRQRTIHTVLSMLATTVVIVFLHQNSSAALVTYTINQRDFAIANRLMMSIEQHPNYPELLETDDSVRVIVMGRLDYSQERPFSHATYPSRSLSFNIIQCNVFACQPPRLGVLFTLIQSDSVKYHTHSWRFETLNATNRDRLRPLFDNMEAFPHTDSVQITDSREVLVLLSKPDGDT